MPKPGLKGIVLFEDDYCLIPLSSKNGLVGWAKVSDEDAAWVSERSWYLGSYGYPTTNFGGIKPTRLHRLINKTPPGINTDHANGDKTDARRSNLRNATDTQNQANRYKPKWKKGNSSPWMGVSWNIGAKKWEVCLTIDHKKIYLGLFTCPLDGATAKNFAAYHHFKEFATYNEAVQTWPELENIVKDYYLTKTVK